jgi:hypothetical protein
MADAYIFQADTYCAECAGSIKRQIAAAGGKPARTDDESTFDSDVWPKGPYPDGGGEADTPQHCGNPECRTFLENPLTGDGYEYVRELIADHVNGEGPGDYDTLNQWIQFYEIPLWVCMEYLPGCLPDGGPRVYFDAESALADIRERAREQADSFDPDSDDAERAAEWESFASRLESADDIDSDYVKETAPDGYVWSVEKESRLHG